MHPEDIGARIGFNHNGQRLRLGRAGLDQGRRTVPPVDVSVAAGGAAMTRRCD